MASRGYGISLGEPTAPTFAGPPDYRDAPKLPADVLNRLLLIAYWPP
jgi:hypothetical protein